MEILLNVIYVLGFALYIHIGTKFITRQGIDSWHWYEQVLEFILVLLWPFVAIFIAFVTT